MEVDDLGSNDFIEKYTEQTILITGGAGFIGSNLVRSLIPANPERIIVLDDFSSSYLWNLPRSSLLDVIQGSILDEEKLKHAFSLKPDFVFHMAAHFANQRSIDHPEPDLMVNGVGLFKVLEQSRRNDVERFVYAGSSCSYGNHCNKPNCEKSVSLTLETPYQIHKLLGELYSNYFFETYGPSTLYPNL